MEKPTLYCLRLDLHNRFSFLGFAESLELPYAGYDKMELFAGAFYV